MPFDGGHNPDDNQFQSLPLTIEIQQITEQISRGAIGRDVYDPRVAPPEGLRALAWNVGAGAQSRILLQNFTRAQALSRRTAIIFDGNTFTRMQEPGLLIGTKIDAIVENGQVYFKRFNNLKQIFDMFDIYREATDGDIRAFANNPIIQIANIDEFSENANRTNRKLIFSVLQSGVPDHRTAQEIVALAATVDVDFTVEGDRLVLEPSRELTKQFRFLDNSIYRSPISNERWMANSRRRL